MYTGGKWNLSGNHRFGFMFILSSPCCSPIVRASVFYPTDSTRNTTSPLVNSAMLYLLVSKGLIKKILISNFIAINFIDRVFDAPAFIPVLKI